VVINYHVHINFITSVTGRAHNNLFWHVSVIKQLTSGVISSFIALFIFSVHTAAKEFMASQRLGRGTLEQGASLACDQVWGIVITVAGEVVDSGQVD
jgi:hypothetical protein